MIDTNEMYKQMWHDLKEIVNNEELKKWIEAIEKTYEIKGDE
jgi:hypothetical protein